MAPSTTSAKAIKLASEACGASEAEITAMLEQTGGDLNAAVDQLLQNPFRPVQSKKDKRADREAKAERVVERRGPPGGNFSGRGGGRGSGRGFSAGRGRGPPVPRPEQQQQQQPAEGGFDGGFAPSDAAPAPVAEAPPPTLEMRAPETAPAAALGAAPARTMADILKQQPRATVGPAPVAAPALEPIVQQPTAPLEPVPAPAGQPSMGGLGDSSMPQLGSLGLTPPAASQPEVHAPPAWGKSEVSAPTMPAPTLDLMAALAGSAAQSVPEPAAEAAPTSVIMPTAIPQHAVPAPISAADTASLQLQFGQLQFSGGQEFNTGYGAGFEAAGAQPVDHVPTVPSAAPSNEAVDAAAAQRAAFAQQPGTGVSGTSKPQHDAAARAGAQQQYVQSFGQQQAAAAASYGNYSTAGAYGTGLQQQQPYGASHQQAHQQTHQQSHQQGYRVPKQYNNSGGANKPAEQAGPNSTAAAMAQQMPYANPMGAYGYAHMPQYPYMPNPYGYPANPAYGYGAYAGYQAAYTAAPQGGQVFGRGYDEASQKDANQAAQARGSQLPAGYGGYQQGYGYGGAGQQQQFYGQQGGKQF